MPKLLQINATANSGSTGKITEQIGLLARANGWDSVIAYGRSINNSQLNSIRIGSDLDIIWHGLKTRVFDKHGLASQIATKKFVEWAIDYGPDIVHLHNIHGYYLNYPILFNWLKEYGIPVIWTLHDCWAFTGHCAYYSYANCVRWEKGCYKCPQLSEYPSSLWIDHSKQNYIQKKKYFSDLPNLHIVTVSDWLKNEVSKSFLSNYCIQTIHNGIDLNIFKPYDNKVEGNQTTILGVASVWDRRKGLDDFIRLREKIPEKYIIKLVGLTPRQINRLPKGIIGIERTSNLSHLAELYSSADIYINTSVEETLGMTSIEAMACGTPAIVYKSTACNEPIENNICKAVMPKDIDELIKAIKIIESEKNNSTIPQLRNWVCKNFDQRSCFERYMKLYNNLL